MSIELNTFEEQVFFTTSMITTTDPSTNRLSSGTGFLIAAPLPAPLADRALLVLITCKHVLFEGRGQISIKLHSRNKSDPSKPDLKSHITLGPATHNEVYFEHDDPTIDVAAINLSSVFETNQQIFYKNLAPTNFVDPHHPELLPAKEIIFIGYPNTHHDAAHNLPILRYGRIASIPKIDFNEKPEFLIDAQVYPGSSGSPVFVPIEGKWQLVGMVGQSVTRLADVELTAGGTPIVRDFIGLGVVYKASAILSITEKITKSFMATHVNSNQ